MSDVNLQKLISLKRRRLQKLKEKEAIFGISAPPEVLIQIEDLENELAHLQAQLKTQSSATFSVPALLAPTQSSRSIKTWRSNAKDPVTAVSIASDGQTLVATTLGKQVQYLSGTGELRWQKEVGNQAWRAALSTNGETCVIGTGSTRPWDLAGRGVYCFAADGTQRWRVDLGASVWGLDMAADGQTVAVGTTRQLICLDGQGHRLWHETIPGLGWSTWVWSTALSADGQRVVAGAADKRIRLLERSGTLVAEHQARGDVFSVAVSADGTAIGAGDNARFVYWLDGQGHLLWEEQFADKIWAVTIDQTGQRLIAGAGEKERHLYCFNRQGQLLWRRHIDGSVSSLALSDGGQRLVAGIRSGGIYIFDGNGNVLTVAKAEKQVRHVAISASGDTVIAGSEDGHIYGFQLPSLSTATETSSIGSKYNINISGPVTGLTIGDGTQAIQNFGSEENTGVEATLGQTSAQDDDNLKQSRQAEAYATARIVDHQPDHPFNLDNTYVLQAGIRSEMAEGFETASILLPSTEETIQFEIVVHAEDMAVQPALMQSFIFNRGQETPLLEFELRPEETGRKQIRVEFFYQRHWLAHINFEVEVVPAPESVPA